MPVSPQQGLMAEQADVLVAGPNVPGQVWHQHSTLNNNGMACHPYLGTVGLGPSMLYKREACQLLCSTRMHVWEAYQAFKQRPV